MTYFRPNIEAMAAYQPGEQPRVAKFIKLNTNENPYPPSSAVRRAIETVLDGGLVRYPDPAADVFRRRAAELHGVEPDWILCGNGSDDILTIVTRALVGERERMRMPYPSYILYETLADIQGAQYDPIPYEQDWSLGGTFTSGADDLKLAIIANPNSPSGTQIAPRQIAEFAERLPCPLLVDEAYVDFASADCISLVRENEKVMVARSLSKGYALAGIRFGYLIAQPPLIERFMKVKDSYNCNALAIAAATAAIDDRSWLAEMRTKVLATRTRLIERLRDVGLQVTDSEANFVWATQPELDLGRVYEQLKEMQVLVRYLGYPGWNEGLRISVGTDDQVDAFLNALGATLV
ncbi:MAG: histidinol-phosphate transaminase [Planctomycetota bacterium]|nr:MAG: histidinol-phosphate transaminase [Planctomycetota bacterium]REJ95794.1 MAG: histidinol-phosphate transaminase [Planctomycetota bacterium]